METSITDMITMSPGPRVEVMLPIPAPYDTDDYPKYKPDKFKFAQAGLL